MVVFVEIINESGEPEQIEVTEDVRAQVLATRELAKAMGRVSADLRVWSTK